MEINPPGVDDASLESQTYHSGLRVAFDEVVCCFVLRRATASEFIWYAWIFALVLFCFVDVNLLSLSRLSNS